MNLYGFQKGNKQKTSLRKAKIASAIAVALMPQLASAEEQAAQNSYNEIEVIEVSAQRRVESIQAVPIAISAFSDETLRKLGAENLNDLGLFTPGLETNNATATQTTFNIRGITTNDFGIGLDPAVAVYIDGVYVGRRGTSNLNFNDIERVEVLKGPQGTLFGRNSAAGAVNILTKRPVDDTEGSIQLTLGNYDKVKLEASYNTPLSDSVAMRTSVVRNYRGGYVDVVGQRDKIGNNNDWSFRNDILWQVNDDLEAVLRFDISEIDQDSRPAATLNTAYGSGDPYGAVETDWEDNKEVRDARGLSLEVNYDLGNMLFTSITAYRDFTRYNAMEDDGSAFDRAYFGSILDEDQSQFSQEFRLTGATEQFKWTLGATYFDEDMTQDTHANFNFQTLDGFAMTNAGIDPSMIPAIQPGLGMAGFFSQIVPAETIAQIMAGTPLQPEHVLGILVLNNYGRSFNELTNNRSQTKSYAVYGDGTYSLTDKLDLTLGLRYSVDKKTFDINTQYQNTIDMAFQGIEDIPIGLAFSVPTQSQQSDKWSKLTPRVVLDYQWTPQLMTYLSYAEGFKSGGYNTLGLAPPVDEETVKSTEVGMKSFWFEQKLKLNLSAFYYDYNDLQQHELDGPAGTVPTYNLRNVDAKGQGIELETQWQVTPQLILSANYGYLDTEYTKWGLFPWEDSVEESDSLLGEPISGMPKHNVYLAADHTVSLDSHLLNFHLDWVYTSERQTDIDGPSLPVLPYNPSEVKGLTDDNRIDSYSLLNARVSLLDEEGSYRISAYVDNLLDEEYLLGIGGQAMAVGSPIANRGLPRMFGVEFNYQF